MIIPLGTRILASPVMAETQTKSGILLASEAKKTQDEATVVRVASGVTTIKPGDHIIYAPYTHIEVADGDTTYIVVKEEDIMAIKGTKKAK